MVVLAADSIVGRQFFSPGQRVLATSQPRGVYFVVQHHFSAFNVGFAGLVALETGHYNTESVEIIDKEAFVEIWFKWILILFISVIGH